MTASFSQKRRPERINVSNCPEACSLSRHPVLKALSRSQSGFSGIVQILDIGLNRHGEIPSLPAEEDEISTLGNVYAYSLTVMAQTNASPTALAKQQAPHVVLLVDDDPAILEYFKPALSSNTLSCITAASVGEAVEALRNSKIDLLVLDWSLDRSGIEVLRAARETSSSMPVIAISGLPYEVRTDAVMHHVDAFLHKPLSGEVLRSQVTQLLQRVDTTGVFLPKRPDEVRSLDQVKAAYIEHVVALLDNNITLAARVLGIHRQTVSAALERAESEREDHCGRGLHSRQEQLSAGDAAKRNNEWVGEDVAWQTT